MTDPIPDAAFQFGPMGSSMTIVPLRDGVSVAIHRLPLDLTKAEATKLANIVLAMAVGDTAEKLK